MAKSTTELEIGVSVRDKFSQSFTELSNKLAKIGKQMKDFGRTASLVITAPLLLAGGSFVKAASDAEEMENRFRAVFGNLADSSSMFASELGDAVGRSTIKIKDSLSTFQGFAVGMGFSREASQQFSHSIATLSLDFASFNNLSDGESQQRFIAALSGSSEVLDKFGINIKESALALELQELGFAGSSMEATEQQKAIARLSIITKSMTMQGATGDAIRTQESFANQMKRLKDTFYDFQIKLGQDVIPALTNLVGAAGNALQWFNGLNDGIKKLILIFAFFLAVVGPATFVIGSVITVVSNLAKAFIFLRTASLALLGPWGLVIAAVTTVAAVVGFKLFNATRETTVATDEMNEQLAALAPNFDKAALEAASMGGGLKGMATEAKAAADEMEKLNNEMLGVFKDVASDEASSKADLAEAIIAQEQKVSGIKSDIRDTERQLRKADDGDQSRSLQDKLSELNASLALERGALRSAADMKSFLRVEVSEANRRADLSDFERTIEDIQKRRVQRLQEHLERLTDIKAQIAENVKKDAAIQASYASAQANMRAETTKTTTHVIAETTAQSKAIGKLFSQLSSPGTTANSTPALGRNIPKRAAGGPVSAGRPYIVGEKGPELFMAGSSGSIIPNNRLGSSGPQIIITGNSFLSDDVAEKMGDLIMSRLKMSNAL